LNVTVLYIGSSLLAPLKQAEEQINRDYPVGLRLAAYNFGASLSDAEWSEVDRDLSSSDVVFVIHVMDGENASRLLTALQTHKERHRAVVVINCMPELMRRTRMGRLDFAQLFGKRKDTANASGERANGSSQSANEIEPGAVQAQTRVRGIARSMASWVGDQAKSHREKRPRNHGSYLKLVDRMPLLLKLVPNAGRLRDLKNYVYLFCYFLQPTPTNIRSMILMALKEYVPDKRLAKAVVPTPERVPSVAIYHPDSPTLFPTFAAYKKWYERRGNGRAALKLTADNTIGLLLMRPQIVSRTRKHYDGLIRAIEAEGLALLPAISTLMDNREACDRFFVEPRKESNGRGNGSKPAAKPKTRVSQIVSLTGFSFVGGPAMNDSEAAARYLGELNRPFRSCVSVDMQSIEAWTESGIGLNPIQAGMQVAIPEIDGATEPFVYGGMPADGVEPVPLEDRCRRLARRFKKWNRLQTAPRTELKIALLLFCFPPNKGNVGTAADLDVFPSVWETLRRLKSDGYETEVPESPDQLRALLLGGLSESYGTTASVAYRMTTDEYRRLCPYVEEIEEEWGQAPGRINTFGGDLLIQGISLGNIFIGVQPTFGYEGDPMRLMMAKSGSPHHGFMAMYTYLEKVFGADAVVHVGTHGAMEFMPGKQVGLSQSCWPDRLIGELPNIYLYSVNNPSEGSIAKRRSYAELISYLTPPIESAGVYKDLASLKELLNAYRQSANEQERVQLYAAIEERALASNF
jgi:magnesium chelatase subunit H